jgi:hypothetical protein
MEEPYFCAIVTTAVHVIAERDVFCAHVSCAESVDPMSVTRNLITALFQDSYEPDTVFSLLSSEELGELGARGIDTNQPQVQ